MTEASLSPRDAAAPEKERIGVMPNSHKIGFLLLFGLLAAAPFAFYPVFVMKIMCFALFACAFNLLLGYGGLLSFGHAAFFGGAAYVSANASKLWGLPPEISVLLGVATGAFLGLIFGFFAIRRAGIYMTMITLAFAQMVYFLSLQATKYTGGEDGVQAIPRNKLFGMIDISSDFRFYFFVLAIFIIGMLTLYRIVHSPFGQVMKAIRENEPRSTSLGYRVARYKLALFVMSAAVAGMAGATKALVFQLASLTDVHWSMSGEVVLMALLGGVGTIFGPVIGAGIIVSMQNYFASFGAWVTVIQGVIFVLGVLLFREGIIGVLSKWLKKPL